MFLKKKFIIFAVFIFFVFVVLTYQGIKGGAATSAFGFFSYPLSVLEKGGSAVINGIEDIFRKYFLIVGKEEENKKLAAEIREMELERGRYLEAQYENRRLRKLLGLKDRRTDHVTSAEVFSRDPTNWFQFLWINKGADDGISKDMVAVTPEGPVGRVHSVLKSRAKIMLITDVNSLVAVMIQPSRVEGMLEGRGDNRCYLRYVPEDADVKVGERVITSGLDGKYPEGLLIGHVSAVGGKSGEFFRMIEVAPSQNLNRVEEVAILKR